MRWVVQRNRSGMSAKVATARGLATLRICSAFVGPTGDVFGFCRWAAPLLRAETGEPWGPGRVEYWLRRECWGRGWVENGSVRLTLAGRIELRAVAGELCGEELEIWREVA